MAVTRTMELSILLLLSLVMTIVVGGCSKQQPSAPQSGAVPSAPPADSKQYPGRPPASDR